MTAVRNLIPTGPRFPCRRIDSIAPLMRILYSKLFHASRKPLEGANSHKYPFYCLSHSVGYACEAGSTQFGRTGKAILCHLCYTFLCLVLWWPLALRCSLLPQNSSFLSAWACSLTQVKAAQMPTYRNAKNAKQCHPRQIFMPVEDQELYLITVDTLSRPVFSLLCSSKKMRGLLAPTQSEAWTRQEPY